MSIAGWLVKKTSLVRVLLLLVALSGIYVAYRPIEWQSHPTSSTSLFELAKSRAETVRDANGRAHKCITVIHFAGKRTELLQNCIFSLLHVAKRRNFLVAASDNLEVCLGLKLPCADVSSLRRRIGSGEYSHFGSAEYEDVTWTKVAVIESLVSQGFTVHSSDFDTVYAPKDFWRDVMRYIQEGGAQAAFQVEDAAINTGSYVVLPSPETKRFLTRWVALANSSHAGNDQLALIEALLNPSDDPIAHMCTEKSECESLSGSGKSVLIRRFYPPFWSKFHDHCVFGQDFHDGRPIDICDPSVLFVHTICSGIGDTFSNKMTTMKELGVWYCHQASGANASTCLSDDALYPMHRPTCDDIPVKQWDPFYVAD